MADEKNVTEEVAENQENVTTENVEKKEEVNTDNENKKEVVQEKKDIKLNLEEDDGVSHALSGAVGTNASNYATVKLTPSSPVTCNKISVKLDTSSNSRNVEINDISIEYREIYKRSG